MVRESFAFRIEISLSVNWVLVLLFSTLVVVFGQGRTSQMFSFKIFKIMNKMLKIDKHISIPHQKKQQTFFFTALNVLGLSIGIAGLIFAILNEAITVMMPGTRKRRFFFANQMDKTTFNEVLCQLVPI
jgi:hypothetical protein